MTSVVLDASALIAFLRNEPGADTVRRRLEGALISSVNYSEVLKKAIEIGGSSEVAQASVRALPVSIVPFDTPQAVATAGLYRVTKPHGLSLADRACVALGVERNADVLTTDREMSKVAAPVKVVLIRGKH